MYNTDRRVQPQALRAPAQHALPSSAAAPAAQQRDLLRAVLEALGRLGEFRVMPFVELDPARPRDEGARRDF